MINRRTFIGTTAAVTVSTLFTNKFAWADEEHRIEAIGLQLYAVRKNMKHDFEGTLAKVASIGYKEIEFAGYFKHTPQQVRTLIDKYSLTSPACHLDYDVFTDENLPQQIESAKVIGQSYLINPWIPEKQRKTEDDWKRVAERFNHVGELCKNAGLEFAYHNHWFEFIPLGGKLPYDTLLESTDPNLVRMEMDLCWITVGGGDPLKYFDRYPGRFPLVHVKDVKKLPKVTASGGRDFGSSMKDMTEVGSGIIDWKRIFAQSEKAGIKHYIVEHDQPRQPFESIKTSYEYLRQLRW